MARRSKSGKELKRRPAFRTEPDRVLIVTEGSKTEPAYFRLLIKELDLTTATVTIVGDGGSAPISVIQEATKQLKLDGDFEQIFCVFDRDRHDSYTKALNTLESLAATRDFKAKTFLAITSVPCFEFWYLLHVSDSRKPYTSNTTSGSPGDQLIVDLKKNAVFCGYDKNNCDEFYYSIADMRDKASRRADHFLSESEKEGTQKHHENPSTRVHLAVRALISIADKQKI